MSPPSSGIEHDEIIDDLDHSLGLIVYVNNFLRLGGSSRWRDGGEGFIGTRCQVGEDMVTLNEIGTDRPVKDELELGDCEPKKMQLPGDGTTDEEVELPGTFRPRRGAGWVGRGLPLPTHRNGTRKDLVDGAGLCSPWSMASGWSGASE